MLFRSGVLQFVAILLGSTLAAKIAGHRGLFHGLFVAIIFCAFYLICNLLIWDGGLSLILIAQKCGIFAASGIIGGLIGVGLSG